MLIFSRTSHFSGKAPRAFTLIELLAVSAIIVVITLVLLLRQSSFDSSTVLRSLAYSVALSVRQTQVYGVSVLGSSNSGVVSYAPAYGLYFSSGSPASYVLFADFNNNGAYDQGTETVKVFYLNAGYTISEVCAKRSDGNSRCTGADDQFGGASINSLSIIFRRPNPDALFFTNIGNELYTSGYVQVRSAGGATRSVLIGSSGQISVQSPGVLP